MHPSLLQAILKAKAYTLGAIYGLIVSARGGIVYRNVPYGTGTGSQLDIYLSPSNSSTVPKQSIVVVHGGGWIAGDKGERTLFCAALAKEGYTVFSINYRLAPQFPLADAIDDCSSALRWVYTHANEYGANPQNITVIGDSAGAHLASLASASYSHVKKLILYYGIYNLETAQQINRPLMRTYLQVLAKDNITSSLSVVSPVSYAQSLPPTLLIASERDPLHTQTTELAEVMQRARKSHKLMILNRRKYAHAVHGFQNLPYSKASKDSYKAVLNFLKE